MLRHLVMAMQKATVPSAPTIGTATAGNAQATVPFTAPTNNGGSPITSYTVTSSPGGITASGAASPITVTGLTNGTAYTFTVTATNAVGTGPASAASNSVTPMVIGQQLYSSAGSYSWTAPAGVTSVSVVCIGGGGGRGGSLGYKNNITVVPGTSYSVVVSGTTGSSYFKDLSTVWAGSGGSPGYGGDGGGNGGNGSYGGGGAAGYAGDGGNGSSTQAGGAGTAGSGGGGGGGGSSYDTDYTAAYGGGGGGVAPYGQGSNGTAGTAGGSGSSFIIAGGGGGGSGGSSGSNTPSIRTSGNGGLFGGNASGATSQGGCVRIIWPGNLRQFPSTRTANE